MYLEAQEDVFWFDLLRDLDWPSLRPVAARYYEGLWQFNEQQARARAERSATAAVANPETSEEATCRLLFERPTLCEDAPILHEPEPLQPATIRVDPGTLRPGRTPPRFAGRAPKCFFAMFKAFMGVAVCGTPPEPQHVRQKLIDNPSFARTCGFTLPDPRRAYRQSDVPSLRKLEQFDQIMSENGLWGEAAVGQVAQNLKEGFVKLEPTLVHDTTHYQAFSSMRVVDLPENQEEPSSNDVKPDETKADVGNPTTTKHRKQQPKRKKRKRKSHPKTSKTCKCPDRANCPHPWVNADEGAGTVVKSTGKMYWAHKASTISFAHQEILLDAVAMTDAASHDSQSLPEHVARVFKLHPDLEPVINRVLDDGAADDQTLKDFFQTEWKIELLAPINPRRRGPMTKDLPRGIDHLTPIGIPICRQGYPLDFLTCRHDTRKFVFQAPSGEDGIPVCRQCPARSQCYRGNAGARRVTIGFERLPWLDPEFPQVSKRFAKVMARRTVIERLHKLMKYDFGEDRLSKRGTKAFQARLDKTLLAMHLTLAHG
ncbi:MAG: transposase [Planctomycetes bacterium]|nr:transposase [Planctomycetota bacterium]